MKEKPSDPFHLYRFIEAQNPAYLQVIAELERGYKSGHWMWFIFPQITGLGTSATARHFAISSIQEAEAYLSHPVLGARLQECSAILLKISGKTAHEIFGSPDDLKFRSCMTLFAQCKGANAVFEENIRKYFNGEQDRLTLEKL